MPEVPCQVSDTEDGPILGGNGEDDLGRHLYCGKCRVNFNGKERVEGAGGGEFRASCLS